MRGLGCRYVSVRREGGDRGGWRGLGGGADGDFAVGIDGGDGGGNSGVDKGDADGDLKRGWWRTGRRRS